MDIRRAAVSVLFVSALASPAACDSDRPVMPDVVGMEQDEAHEALGGAGIEHWGERLEITGEAERNVVTDQEPAPGEVVESDTQVQITVEAPPGG